MFATFLETVRVAGVTDPELWLSASVLSLWCGCGQFCLSNGKVTGLLCTLLKVGIGGGVLGLARPAHQSIRREKSVPTKEPLIRGGRYINAKENNICLHASSPKKD